MTDSDILTEAKEAFDLAVDSDSETNNRERAEDDLRFARLGEQWPEDIEKRRRDEGRPCLTINKMPSFIRQVVNDSRLTKPAIKVYPADSAADPETAEIINGLIRNIEYTSNADVAYDTAVECATSCGFGYFRVGLDYTHDDAFDLDINIQRVSNPFQIYGDPHSVEADSSDWNSAFVTEYVPKKKFETDYKGAEPVDWRGDYEDLKAPWVEDEAVLIAEWWVRDEIDREIVRLTDGTVLSAEAMEEPVGGVPRFQLLAVQGIGVEGTRVTKSWRVRQHTLTGAEVLKTEDWPGRYIPIVPVYGDEVDVLGKRYFKSLIHDAKDAQRMFNYWRTTSTELVALAPKTPFIGPAGAFDVDAARWATANTQSHPYLEYDATKGPPPQRQAFAGPPAAALQEAINASDDMKAITGIHDASLGARSNEISGRAILARQREGDVATFHFIDNLARAIRHAGRIIIDLIPHVYDAPRIVRVLGEDGTPEVKTINRQEPVTDESGQPVQDDLGQIVTRMHDLTTGKYDLTVSSGPSFSTRREEAANQMMDLIRSFPQAAPIMGDLVAKNLDWPGADEIAERLQKMLPTEIGADIPPQVQAMIEEGQALIETLQAENEKLKSDRALDARKVEIDAFEAETDRLKAVNDMGAVTPDQVKALVLRAVEDVLADPDVQADAPPVHGVEAGQVPTAQ